MRRGGRGEGEREGEEEGAEEGADPNALRKEAKRELTFMFRRMPFLQETW